MIDKDGAQQALFPYNDPGQLPIRPLCHPNGEWLRLEIALPGYSVWLRAWQVQVGRVKLYLLDSNDAANFPAHRGITSELYGGGPELRLKQELLLGIGGWRLLAGRCRADALYERLEREVIHEFYARDEQGSSSNGTETCAKEISSSSRVSLGRRNALFRTYYGTASGREPTY